MIDGVDSEDFEMWQANPVTVKFYEHLKKQRMLRIDQMLRIISTNDLAKEFYFDKGKIKQLDELIELLGKKG